MFFKILGTQIFKEKYLHQTGWRKHRKQSCHLASILQLASSSGQCRSACYPIFFHPGSFVSFLLYVLIFLFFFYHFDHKLWWWWWSQRAIPTLALIFHEEQIRKQTEGGLTPSPNISKASYLYFCLLSWELVFCIFPIHCITNIAQEPIELTCNFSTCCKAVLSWWAAKLNFHQKEFCGIYQMLCLCLLHFCILLYFRIYPSACLCLWHFWLLLRLDFLALWICFLLFAASCKALSGLSPLWIVFKNSSRRKIF